MRSSSRKVAAAFLVAGPLLVSARPAGATPTQPKLLVHVTSPTTKNACDAGGLTACEQAVTTGILATDYYVHVLVEPGTEIRDSGDGIGGVQFGIRYQGVVDPVGNPTTDGINIFSWTLCGTLEFASPQPAWPGPESGNLITWDTANNCRTTLTSAGYFYMAAYANAILCLRTRPVDMLAKVVTCQLQERLLGGDGSFGAAAFNSVGGASGCNPCNTFDCLPCRPDAVEPTTWSRIKSQVGR
jgi:hypothetical protein